MSHNYDVTARFMGDSIKFQIQAEAADPTEEMALALKGAHIKADSIFERKSGAGAAPVVAVQLAKD
jgi:hypothetical protein